MDEEKIRTATKAKVADASFPVGMVKADASSSVRMAAMAANASFIVVAMKCLKKEFFLALLAVAVIGGCRTAATGGQDFR